MLPTLAALDVILIAILRVTFQTFETCPAFPKSEGIQFRFAADDAPIRSERRARLMRSRT